MEILVLIGQRKGAYAEQYAPEALAVIDANGNDENPGYMRDEHASAVRSNDFDAVTILRIRLSPSMITERLYPSQEPVIGQILPPETQP